MVQVIENWAYLVGRLGPLTEADAPGASGLIDVEEVRDDGGWPNLLGRFAGQQLTVRVPDAARGRWQEGTRAVVRARLGGPGVVWAGGSPEDLTVEAG
jgi:hypothetical protein